MQDCSHSTALAMELRQSCSKSSICDLWIFSTSTLKMMQVLVHISDHGKESMYIFATESSAYICCDALWSREVDRSEGNRFLRSWNKKDVSVNKPGSVFLAVFAMSSWCLAMWLWAAGEGRRLRSTGYHRSWTCVFAGRIQYIYISYIYKIYITKYATRSFSAFDFTSSWRISNDFKSYSKLYW